MLTTAPAAPRRYRLHATIDADRLAGTLTDARGQRLIAAPLELLAALGSSLEREIGDAAADVQRKIGDAWAAADMRAFAARATEEFGCELAKVHMTAALAAWWWPWASAGWGLAEFDLRRAAQKLVRVDVANSAAARAAGQVARPACHLYAGLFAGAFRAMTGRDLACVEVQCAAAGADGCRFLVTTIARARTALDARNAGTSADEIERRLIETA